MTSQESAPARLVTIERHILDEQAKFPDASGDLTNLLYDLALAAKIIAREVNKAGLLDILGKAGLNNSSGDEVKKLDVFADRWIYRALDHTGRVAVMASEESEAIIPIPEKFRCGKYVLLFDPLDGSSNIDANAPIGTIFSIHKKISKGERGTLQDCLQPGHRQVAAGYVLYGTSTMLVYTTGAGVAGFTLDRSIGEFILSHPNIRVPERGKIYSVNEQNTIYWDPRVRAYVDWVKQDDKATQRPRAARYIGSMVADVHRTLMYGGLFMYPGSRKDPKGKLRLLYEASPMAFVMEQAGGAAIDGEGRILDIEARELHQRTPVYMGSKDDVSEVRQFLSGEHPAVRELATR
ncbi:MAG TPA: class 1 fructose-bisphosphatase [Planctomycetota bacterium]|nr:class 1 fructose-bisphosphatase [Planctomycetota bacterium]